MNNKILIELIVPELNSFYSVYIPVNIKMGEVIELLNKALYDLSGEFYNCTNNYLYNDLSDKFNFNLFIYETNIKNGSKIILL